MIFKIFTWLLTAIAVVSCSREERTYTALGYELPLFSSHEDTSYESAQERFSSWLVAQGLRMIDQPRHLKEMVAPHFAEDQFLWFQAPAVKGEMLVGIMTNPRRREITLRSYYSGILLPGELNTLRDENKEIWLKAISWFESSAPGNSVMKDSRQWLSTCRRRVEDAYTPILVTARAR